MKIQKVLTHHRYADKKLEGVKDWKVSDKTKKDIKDFINDYKSGEVTGRIGTDIDASVERILQYLKPMLEHLNKNKDDYKRLKEALLQDKILSHLKKPYSLKTKKMMFNTLSQFIKWKYPDDYVKLSKPLKIRIDIKKKEVRYLTLAEIDKLYRNCKSNKERYVIAVLFGSGARAEEFLNLRYSDFELPGQNESFVKIRIRNGFSKTEGRTISLYYDKSLEAVRDHLNDVKGIDPDDTVLKDSYNGLREWLTRIGKNTLRKNIHFHLFRSSAATWLSSRMNRQQMCVYFGWSFSSNMVDVYTSRNGLDMNTVTDNIERTELENLKIKLEKDNQDKSIQLEKERQKHAFELEEMRIKVDEILDFMKSTIQQFPEIRAVPIPVKPLSEKELERFKSKFNR